MPRPKFKPSIGLVPVAGGRRKVRAILAALRGGWIDVLITDQRAAESLLLETE